MVVGGILMLTAETPEPATAGAMSQNLVPDGTRTGDPSAEGEVPWSEAIFKYGFSFFVGFAMGYAVRSFLKLALIFVGVLAICLFALDYAGFVTVEWEAMDKAFSGLMERVKTQVSGFRSFITGSLPSAGLAATGLYAGFRKRG